MKNLTTIGVVIILLGVAGLIFGHFSYTETKPVINVGPLQVSSQDDHTVWIPTVAGIVVVLAGLSAWLWRAAVRHERVADPCALGTG